MKRVDEILTKALSDALGIEVYPLIASEDAALPLIIYGEESFLPNYSKDGMVEITAHYSIDIYSTSYDECAELEDKAMKTLRAIREDPIRDIRIEGGGSDYFDSYVKTIKVEIAYGA